MAPRARDLVEVIHGLADADASRGIHLVDSRFEVRFHPYRELFWNAMARARSFRARGVQRRDAVLLPMSTDLDTIASFLGLVVLGAVPFSVSLPLMGQDPDAHRRHLARLAAAFDVRWWCCPVEIGAGFEGVPADRVLCAGGEVGAERLGGPLPEPAQVAPDDVAFVQFSSGSTSQPKGIPITHRSLLYNLSLIVDNDRRSEGSVFVSWLPLYHDMGLVGGLLTNFMCPNTLVLMPPKCFIARPIFWLDAITRFRGTVTAIPNFALDVCTQRISDEQLRDSRPDLGSLRYVYNGSEPVRPASIRRFEERLGRFGFVPGSIYPVYGMAEATLIVSAPPFEHPETVRTFEGRAVPSVGYPLGDFQVEIRDEDGRRLGADRVGEIHLRGTSVTRGYLGSQGEAAGRGADGWLATGDLGFLDAEGRLYVTGRKKDLLIVQGQNFYGHDIAACVEEGLGLRPGTVHAFSVEGEEAESVVVMVAVPRPRSRETAGGQGPSVDPDRLRADVYKLILREFGLAVRDVHLVQRLPKTTSGKIMRHECLRMYVERRA